MSTWIYTGMALAAMMVAARPGDDTSGGEPAWKVMRGLVGTWEGEGDGTFGASRIERTYELVLSGTYVRAKTRSVAEGDVHEDWEIISFDKMRGTPVIRQFNSEGFVNRYVLESCDTEKRRLVFVAEHIENGPPGMRARVTLELPSPDEIVETFELAMPGQELAPCVHTRLKRKR